MSRVNVELARRGYEEFSRTGAMPEDLIHPDVEFDPTRVMPDLGVVRGLDRYLAALRDYSAPFDDWHVEVIEIIDAEDQLVISVRDSGRPKGSRSTISNRYVHLLTFRDGKVARLDVYLDKAEALEAVGLRE